MPFDLGEMLAKDATLVALGAVATAAVTGAFSWLSGHYKAGIERKQAVEATADVGFKHLLEITVSLRADLDRLRSDLEAERRARRSAEEEVHTLRAEILTLRDALNRAGVPLPHTSGQAT